jgi:hypothetical protein
MTEEPGSAVTNDDQVRTKGLTGGQSQARLPKYDFQAFEAKWRARWEEQKLYQVDLHRAQKPFYNLMMFPYPSAEGRACWQHVRLRRFGHLWALDRDAGVRCL